VFVDEIVGEYADFVNHEGVKVDSWPSPHFKCRLSPTLTFDMVVVAGFCISAVVEISLCRVAGWVHAGHAQWSRRKIEWNVVDIEGVRVRRMDCLLSSDAALIILMLLNLSA
jgi:hypothetical protein